MLDAEAVIVIGVLASLAVIVMTPPSATAVTALLFSVFAFISAAICPATTAAVPAVVASYVACAVASAVAAST